MSTDGHPTGTAVSRTTVGMNEPRRLRGLKATATSCIASLQRPGLVAAADEDGCICWFDLRCKDVLTTMDVGNHNPITSLCFKPGNEDIIYASTGNEVKCFDVHMTASWKQLESYNYNKDEINQIACHSKSSFLAAADDSGDVKIFDMHQQCLYKTLRAGHESDGCGFLLAHFSWNNFYFQVLAASAPHLESILNPLTFSSVKICSSVQFLHWRPWEVITGGLDSKLVMWDFSKGCRNKILDFGLPDAGSRDSTGQLLNPAFIHALVVPQLDMVDKLGKICVVARGDGVVTVINTESELAAFKSKNSSKKGTKSTSKGSASTSDAQSQEQNNQKLHLDYSMGGHTAAVSCVAFSMFGEKGKFILSGGNDKSVKVWDWFKSVDAGQISSGNDLLTLNINMSKKVNWLCTTTSDSENLVVCDTSKFVKVYTVG